MRVIAGSARGRRLSAIGGARVRPTSDRVREALFSILASRFDLTGTTLLDLFAGSGALGVEALSRGAARVVFVERSRQAMRILEANLRLCGFVARAQISPLPVARALSWLECGGVRFDGVFLDPPYGKGLVDQTLTRLGELAVLRGDAWVMVEAHVDDRLEETYGRLRLTATRRYGKTLLVLFMVESAS